MMFYFSQCVGPGSNNLHNGLDPSPRLDPGINILEYWNAACFSLSRSFFLFLFFLMFIFLSV